MRLLLLIALSTFFALAPSGWSSDAAAAGADPDSERGAIPAIKRTWRSTVDAGGSAIRSTGSFLGSGVSAVTGLFKTGEPSSSVKESKQRLRLEGECSSNPVVLKSTPSISVRLRVVNPTKRAQAMEFSSGKRVEAVLRDVSGKILARASEGAEDSHEGMLVTVNPGERLEYSLSLPTAGMVAGNVYTLEAAVTGQAGLLARMAITAR